MIRSLLALSCALVTLAAAAQKNNTHQMIDIRTNAVCDMCEKTIETEMLYEKGVKAVDVDLQTNIIHITADTKKTSVEKLRTAVAKLGYSADNALPDMAAREKLPDCCKKEGCGMPMQQAPK